MALKPDRHLADTDIACFMNETAEAGGVVVYSTIGSGAALDQPLQLVTYAASQSGKVPAGLLLSNMVDIDLTRQHLNPYKDEVQKGGKVALLKRGYVVTNKALGSLTISATANVAYLVGSGFLTNVATNSSDRPPVGRFESALDEDGYARVRISLPAVA